MSAGPIIRDLARSGLRRSMLSGLIIKAGVLSEGTALAVAFGDGTLTITPRDPVPPATFTVAFGDGQITITP